MIDTKNNEFRVSRCTAPISVVGGEADFTVIIDRCSIEVFADQGRVFLSCTNEDIVQDRNILRMTASAGQDMTIKALEVTPLKSIWCDK